MKPAHTLLLTLTVVVAALAVYHFGFRESETAGDAVDAAAQAEAKSLDRELARVEEIFGAEYDAASMRAIIDKSGIPLTPEQAKQVLPMLHTHLLELQANLKAARAAILAGDPPEKRTIFHSRAAQAHSRFLGKLRTIIPPADATALFKASPAMFPPLPGTAAPRKTGPKLDPMTGMPVAGAAKDGGSK